MELKVLGQNLLLNVPQGQEQYYADIAYELNQMMDELGKKTQLRSDIKIAVSVAYKLLLENKQLKETISCYSDIDNRIDDMLIKLENK